MFAFAVVLLLAVGISVEGAGYPSPGNWPPNAWRNELDTNYIIHSFQGLSFAVAFNRCNANGVTSASYVFFFFFFPTKRA